MSEWDRFKVETSCLMAKREQLISMFQEREVAERERFQLKEEKFNYQRQLGQMVERIGSQIEQLDRKIDSEAPPLPSGIVTPPCGESPSGGATVSDGTRITLIFRIRTHST